MIKCTFSIWRLFSAGNALHFLEIHKVLPAKMCLFPTKNISPSALGELIIVYLNGLGYFLPKESNRSPRRRHNEKNCFAEKTMP